MVNVGEWFIHPVHGRMKKIRVKKAKPSKPATKKIRVKKQSYKPTPAFSSEMRKYNKQHSGKKLIPFINYTNSVAPGYQN